MGRHTSSGSHRCGHTTSRTLPGPVTVNPVLEMVLKPMHNLCHINKRASARCLGTDKQGLELLCYLLLFLPNSVPLQFFS